MPSDLAHAPRSLRWLVVTLATGLLTGAVGFWAGSRSSEPELRLVQELQRQSAALARMDEQLTRLAQRPAVPVVHCEATEGAKPLAAEASVAQALDSALDTALARQAQAAKDEQEVLRIPTHDNLAAFARGEQLVDAALKANQWNDAQAESLRELVSQVTDEQASSLMRRLFVAVNEGKLTVRTSGPPF